MPDNGLCQPGPTVNPVFHPTFDDSSAPDSTFMVYNETMIQWPDEQAWPRATPESQGMSSRILESVSERSDIPVGHMIVIRNGYDVWHYGDPYGQTDGWWASSARSWLTTAFAMLIERGVIHGGKVSVEMPVNQLPSRTARTFNAEVKIKHLLSYTACASPPGSRWRYSCNWTEMHAIFTEITGQSPWDYINAELKPVIGGASWRAIDRDGTLRVVGSPPDMARWGYLWLRGGLWKETRIIDEWLVSMATSPLVGPDGNFAHPNEGWQIHTNDGGVWDGLPEDSYAALGANATSMIWVCPSLDLVVARLGPAPEEHDRIDEFLLPVVRAVLK